MQIGQLTPASPAHADYRLAVDGKLVAKSIFVTQGTNWADFVFAPTYALQPLPELEAYLKQHRHLPAIPSAAEVEKNGVNLGDMDARLLQSLEELMLHVIALGKQNAPMRHARHHLNATLLPDGTVLVTGGSRILSAGNQNMGVLEAKIWTPMPGPDGPTGPGTWTTVAPMAEARMYHATAVLLPDGRVLSAGGEEVIDYDPFVPNNNNHSPTWVTGSRSTFRPRPAAAPWRGPRSCGSRPSRTPST